LKPSAILSCSVSQVPNQTTNPILHHLHHPRRRRCLSL
jgi:hypothetical protein